MLITKLNCTPSGEYVEVFAYNIGDNVGFYYDTNVYHLMYKTPLVIQHQRSLFVVTSCFTLIRHPKVSKQPLTGGGQSPTGRALGLGSE